MIILHFQYDAWCQNVPVNTKNLSLWHIYTTLYGLENQSKLLRKLSQLQLHLVLDEKFFSFSFINKKSSPQRILEDVLNINRCEKSSFPIQSTMPHLFLGMLAWLHGSCWTRGTDSGRTSDPVSVANVRGAPLLSQHAWQDDFDSESRKGLPGKKEVSCIAS